MNIILPISFPFRCIVGTCPLQSCKIRGNGCTYAQNPKITYLLVMIFVLRPLLIEPFQSFAFQISNENALCRQVSFEFGEEKVIKAGPLVLNDIKEVKQWFSEIRIFLVELVSFFVDSIESLANECSKENTEDRYDYFFHAVLLSLIAFVFWWKLHGRSKKDSWVEF